MKLKEHKKNIKISLFMAVLIEKTQMTYLKFKRTDEMYVDWWF